MPVIDAIYEDGGYDFNYIQDASRVPVASIVVEKRPTITYKEVKYKLVSIKFSGPSNTPPLDNSGQLFLIHKSDKGKSFIFVILIKPTSVNTEPSLDLFLNNPTGNKRIDLLKLINLFVGNSFSVKTNTTTDEFSCLIGHMRLTDRTAIDNFKKYTNINPPPTSQHTIDSDDGTIRIGKNPTRAETRICKRVDKDMQNKVEKSPIDEIQDDIDQYKLIQNLGISFIVIFSVMVFYMIYAYFFSDGTGIFYPAKWMGITPKFPDTDFFNNPFPTMMGGGKKARTRLGKKRV